MMRKDGESRTVRLVSPTHDQLFTVVLNDVLNQPETSSSAGTHSLRPFTGPEAR